MKVRSCCDIQVDLHTWMILLFITFLFVYFADLRKTYRQGSTAYGWANLFILEIISAVQLSASPFRYTNIDVPSSSLCISCEHFNALQTIFTREWHTGLPCLQNRDLSVQTSAYCSCPLLSPTFQLFLTGGGLQDARYAVLLVVGSVNHFALLALTADAFLHPQSSVLS